MNFKSNPFIWIWIRSRLDFKIQSMTTPSYDKPTQMAFVQPVIN